VSWVVLAGIVLTFLTAVLSFVQSLRAHRKVAEVRKVVDQIKPPDGG